MAAQFGSKAKTSRYKIGRTEENPTKKKAAMKLWTDREHDFSGPRSLMKVTLLLVSAAMRWLQVMSLTRGSWWWTAAAVAAFSSQESLVAHEETQGAETITAPRLHSPAAYHGRRMDSQYAPVRIPPCFCKPPGLIRSDVIHFEV